MKPLTLATTACWTLNPYFLPSFSFLATSLIMMISSVWATFNVSCMKTPLMTPTAAKPNTPLNRIVNMLKAGLRSSCKSRATGTQVPSVSWNIVSIPPRLRTSCMIMICLVYWMPYHCIKCVCVCIGTCSSLDDEKTGLERCRSCLYHSIPKVNIYVHTLAWPKCHPFWSQTQNWLKQAEKLRGNVPKYSKSFRCTSVSVWIAWSELTCKKLIANWPNLGSLQRWWDNWMCYYSKSASWWNWG